MTRDPDRPVCPDFADDGLPQATRVKCDTCILRRGGSDLVSPTVVRDLVRRHIDVGAVVVCHKTLQDFGDLHETLGYAACRGFLDSFGEQVLGARVVPMLFGGWHLVDIPED